MYTKIEPALRMTKNEASERYPDSYILMRMDNMHISNIMGTVHYIGDNMDELFSLITKNEYDEIPFWLVTEGMKHRRSLGGIVVGT